jgi:hypothetical protein
MADIGKPIRKIRIEPEPRPAPAPQSQPERGRPGKDPTPSR